MKLSLPNVTLVGVEGVEKNLSKFLFAAEQCCKDIEFGEVKLLSHLDFDHKDRIEIGKIHNTAEYSAFIFHDIHNYISTEFMIIFQWDGFILNSSSWDQDFLNYDYVGSPWFDGKVGNGGFSLRSKKLMELCSKIQPMDPFEFLRTHHGGIFKEFGTTHEDGLFTPNDDALPAQLVAEDKNKEFEEPAIIILPNGSLFMLLRENKSKIIHSIYSKFLTGTPCSLFSISWSHLFFIEFSLYIV